MKIIFTSHAENRIKQRKLSNEDVFETINRPDVTIKKHEKYYFQKKVCQGIIEVVCEKTENNIKVITVYWM